LTPIPLAFDEFESYFQIQDSDSKGCCVIVCLCRASSDATIRQAIDEGARSVSAVGAVCGAGTGCGACRSHIHSMIVGAGQPCAEGGAGCSDCPRRTESALGCEAA